VRRLQPGLDQPSSPVAGQFGPLCRGETGYRIVFITGTHCGQTGRDVPRWPPDGLAIADAVNVVVLLGLGDGLGLGAGVGHGGELGPAGNPGADAGVGCSGFGGRLREDNRRHLAGGREGRRARP
jgi:hypothetical protein